MNHLYYKIASLLQKIFLHPFESILQQMCSIVDRMDTCQTTLHFHIHSSDRNKLILFSALIKLVELRKKILSNRSWKIVRIKKEKFIVKRADLMTNPFTY